MGGFDAAIMAMIGVYVSAAVLAERQKRQYQCVQTMQNCILRISDILCFVSEQPTEQFLYINLFGGKREKWMTNVLHKEANNMLTHSSPLLQEELHKGSKACAGYYAGIREEHLSIGGMMQRIICCSAQERILVLSDINDRLLRALLNARRICSRRSTLIRALGAVISVAAFLIMA